MKLSEFVDQREQPCYGHRVAPADRLQDTGHVIHGMHRGKAEGSYVEHNTPARSFGTALVTFLVRQQKTLGSRINEAMR
jgi:hypothetical protein